MKRNLVFLLLGLLVATGSYAQTTGTIEGTIIDENSAALPGVTVEASSPALQGAKVAVSDVAGKFRLVFLPPGTYKVKLTLSGFANQEQENIAVALGKTVTLQVQMRSSFKEEVVVSGAAPTVDVRSTDIGNNMASGTFLNLPLGRNFTSVVNTTPGTSTDASGTMVYGSTGAENAYYIDGINTTEVERGRTGKQLNFEFVQEVQVKTGGYQAEYGRATGGLINVLTKSGGNEYHGDAFMYYDNSSLQDSVSSDVQNFRENLSSNSSFVADYDRNDYGVDLGGYIAKDKLWFFVAYDRLDITNKNQVAKDFSASGGATKGTIINSTEKRDLWSAKLTWRATDNHSLIFSAFGDPGTLGGMQRAPSGPETVYLEEIKRGGTDAILKYEGVLGQNLVINALVSQHNEQRMEDGPGFGLPMTVDRTTPTYRVYGTEVTSGGLGFENRDKFRRDSYRLDGSYFLSNFGGDHEFKVGIDYERIDVDSNKYYSGGDLLRKRCLSGGYDPATNYCKSDMIYYYHEHYLSHQPPGGYADPTIDQYSINPFTVKAKSDGNAAYIQDSWRVSSALTINLGLRWEQQKLYDKNGDVTGNFTDEWAPRFGFVWDFKGDGTSKLYGSAGRFYEAIPMDMAIRAFGGEITMLNANQKLDTAACDTALKTKYGLTCRVVGKENTPIAPDTTGQYIDEYVLGLEYELAKDLAGGIKYINRKLPRVVEDSLGSDQGYYIGNPGYGIMNVAWDENYERQYPAFKPNRTFEGVELTLKRRFTSNYQMMVSYLYSKMKGNYDGTFQASTGQLDPNLNSAFDYAEFQVNNDGYLANDRTHQFRLEGFYNFNFGLNLGISAYYRTGVPITAMGYDVNYRNYELYLSQRGEWDRTDDDYEMDLHLGYPIKLGGAELHVLVDVFNLINRQGETGRDQRYDLNQIFYVINYDTGAINPAIKNGTPCTSAAPAGSSGDCNKYFNTSNAWQAPRSIRLGLRLTF